MKNTTQHICIHLPLKLCIAFLGLTPLITPAEKPRAPVFYLASESWDKTDFNNQTGCKILRELVRQSLLVSAELDHGWIPRDEVMGDPAPTSSSGPDLKLYFKFMEQQSFTYRISLKNTGSPLVETTLPSSIYDVTIYQKVLTNAEQQARELMPDLLKTQFQPAKVSPASPTNLYDIANLDFLTLWQQLRSWDREVREYGESPERLSALARGYSTLGLASYDQFSNAPKACMARGLVYAQRMVVKYPESPQSYYTRAYAWTLTGLDVFASDDLEKARQLGGNPPAWLPVLETYMDYDLKRLEQQMKDKGFNAQLAGLLGVEALHNTDVYDWFYDYSSTARKQNPALLQAFNCANMIGANWSDLSTSTSLESLDGVVRDHLQVIPEIGTDAQQAVITQQTTPATISGLIGQMFFSATDSRPRAELSIQYPVLFDALNKQAENDPLSPSLPALANLIRDARFTLGYFHLTRQDGRDFDEALAKLLPDVEGHPYAPLLKALADGADVRTIAGQTALGDPGMITYDLLWENPFASLQPAFADMEYWKARMTGWNNFDRNAFDLASYARKANRDSLMRYTSILLGASPNHYLGVMAALGSDDIPTKELVEQHGKIFETSPEANCLLGQRYVRENQLDKAGEAYQKSLSIEPNRAAVQGLADISLKQGNRKEWLEQMVASLEVPDIGIVGTRTESDICDELLMNGEWDKVEEFCNTHMGSKSETTLKHRAWVHGLLGQGQQASDALDDFVEEHGFDYCLMSYPLMLGFKPSASAKKAMDEFYRANLRGNVVDRANAAAVDLCRGHPDKAVDVLMGSLRDSNDPWYGAWAALICEHEGWNDRRDKILTETADRYLKLGNPSHNRQGLKQFVDIYRRANASNELGYEDITELAKFAYGYRDEGFNVDAHAFAGELFLLKGAKDLAQQVFTDAIVPKYMERIVEFIPYIRLREMGIDPVQLLQERREEQLGHDE